MHALLHVLGELAAATPPPKPPGVAAAPAHPINVRVGQAGEWFGPSVVIFASLALDWSALGQAALRDRIAAAGYYASTVAVISIFGWAATVQGWFNGSWSWQLAGSAIAAVLHVSLVIAMFGARAKTIKGMSKKIRDLIHMEHADSSANRINSTLLGWSVVAATSSVLARGPMAGFVHFVGTALTGIWAWLANIIIGWIGG
jgi:hypothetical protein